MDRHLMSRRARLLSAMLAGALLAALVWLLWPRSPALRSPDLVANHPERRPLLSPAARTVAVPLPKREPVEPEPERVEACVADAQLAARTYEAFERCHEAMLAADCPAPLIPEPGDGVLEAHRALVEAELSRQCGDTADWLQLDCSEMPCVLVARADHRLQAKDCVEGLLPVGAEPVVAGWAPIAWALQDEEQYVQFYKAMLEAREPARFARLARALEATGRVDGKPDLCGLHAALDSSPAGCDRLVEWAGCGESAPGRVPLPPEVVAAHLDEVDDLVDELEEKCAPFRATDWTVDCAELPCSLLLAIPEDAELDDRYGPDAAWPWWHVSRTCGKIMSPTPAHAQVLRDHGVVKLRLSHLDAHPGMLARVADDGRWMANTHRAVMWANPETEVWRPRLPGASYRSSVIDE